MTVHYWVGEEEEEHDRENNRRKKERKEEEDNDQVLEETKEEDDDNNARDIEGSKEKVEAGEEGEDANDAEDDKLPNQLSDKEMEDPAVQERLANLLAKKAKASSSGAGSRWEALGQTLKQRKADILDMVRSKIQLPGSK